jgi:aryl-alcohol dehydrogenase-like predicted oxidoreductase
MEMRPLGRTGTQVSAICLGTMTFGAQNTEAEAHAQLDAAVAAGINFIDTAEMYPSPPSADTQGHTEQHIGSWLARRGGRDRLILATKVTGPSEHTRHVRGGRGFRARADIETAIDGSLKRLRTDYVDLYQLHWPDRDTNYFGRLNYHHAPEKDGAPLAETLGVLADLADAGKIRFTGVSNETPWGVAECLRAAAAGLPRISAIQNPYSLLNRTFEIGLAEFAHREQIGLLAYSPLGFGVLTGKYLDGNRPPGARLTTGGGIYKRYTNEQGQKATAAYVRLARDAGLSPAQMALAFVASRPFVTSTIIGASGLDQLHENIDSVHIGLPKDILRAIEDIHTEYSNPCP